MPVLLLAMPVLTQGMGMMSVGDVANVTLAVIGALLFIGGGIKMFYTIINKLDKLQEGQDENSKAQIANDAQIRGLEDRVMKLELLGKFHISGRREEE